MEQFIFNDVKIIKFCLLWLVCLVSYLRNITLTQSHEEFSRFFGKGLVPISNLNFRSMIYLSQTWDKTCNFVYRHLIILAYIIENKLFDHRIIFVKSHLSTCLHVCFWTYLFNSIWYFSCIFMLLSYIVLITIVLSLKIKYHWPLIAFYFQFLKLVLYKFVLEKTEILGSLMW